MAAPTGFERRLISPRLRPAVAVLAVLAATGVAVLAVAYAGRSSAGRVDGTADRWLIGHFGAHVGLVRAVADLGNPVPIIVVTLLGVAGLLRLGRARSALLAASAPAVATAITELILKPLVDRTHAGGASFPSGHATALCAVVVAFVVLVFERRTPQLPRWLQVSGCLAAVGLAVCVCAALAAAQYHYVSDTVGGAGVAVATVLVLALVIDAWSDRADRADRAGRSPATGIDHGLSQR